MRELPGGVKFLAKRNEFKISNFLFAHAITTIGREIVWKVKVNKSNIERDSERESEREKI